MIVGEDVAVLADDEAGAGARTSATIDVDLHDRGLEGSGDSGDAPTRGRTDRIACGADRSHGDSGNRLGLRDARHGEAHGTTDGARDQRGERKPRGRQRDHASATGLVRAGSGRRGRCRGRGAGIGGVGIGGVRRRVALRAVRGVGIGRRRRSGVGISRRRRSGVGISRCGVGISRRCRSGVGISWRGVRVSRGGIGAGVTHARRLSRCRGCRLRRVGVSARRVVDHVCPPRRRPGGVPEPGVSLW